MKVKLVRTGILAAILFTALFVFPAQPAHAAACSFTSNVSPSGNWSAAGSWTAVGTDCSSYPGQTFAGDTVIIANGDTITLNTNVTANALASLQVGQGASGTLTITGGNLTTNGLTINNGGTLTINDSNNRTLTVNGSITINNSGSFVTANASTGNTHTLSVQGNMTNNGTLDLVNGDDVVNVTFNGSANQTVSGSGGTTDFNLITINNSGANGSNIVDITSANFTTPVDFLTLTDGWFRLSTGATLDLSGGNLSLTAPDGFIVNHASAIVNMGNNDIVVNGGNFQLVAGTVSLGNGNDLFQVSSGTAILSGGTLDIQGQFQMTGGTTTISGATISIDPQTSNNLGTTVHLFEAQGNSNVTFTSGTVVIVDPHSGTGTGNSVQIVSGAGAKNFTGSTFQLGNGTSITSGSADGFDVNCGSGLALGNLVINNPSGTNRHTRLVTNNCTLSGNLTITAGTFQLNGQNLTLAGNFTNNGTFTPGGNTVTLNGSAAQTIGGASATTFNNLTINNASDVSLTQNATVNGTLALTAGNLIAGNGTNQLSLGCTGAVTSAGGGDVVGDVVRTCAFVAGTNYTFNNPNTLLNFASGGTFPTSILFNLVRTKPPQLDIAVPRTYTITPTGGSGYSATLRLRYANGAELTDMNETFLRLWRHNGTRYTLQGGTVQTDPTNPYVWRIGVTVFSPWAISDNGSATAVTLSAFGARSDNLNDNAMPIFALVSLSSLMMVGAVLFRRR